MKEAVKNTAIKTEVNHAVVVGDQNRKKTFKRLIQVMLLLNTFFDRSQNYLIFQPLFNYFTAIAGGDTILA